ncbi:MAG TPA: host attachment protein [Candidatus Sulfotelmatobacter sp.]|nr:host attachment protein [Candidatus Sulfotelmatobacter sp.]
MSITREQIRELAEFQDDRASAVSFYFQPTAPQNRAHKEESIRVKDLAREALRQRESQGQKDSARVDIDRILRLSAEFRSNGVHGKAVFACSEKNLWREYELPASVTGTQMFVGRRFHLKPLAHLLGASPLLGVVLVDRHRARIFDLRLGELIEREDLFHPLPRRGRSDGFAGYDGGHAQRRVEDEVRQHFKHVAATLKELLERGVFEKWILACQDAHRPLFEPRLHPYVQQALIGRFHCDLGHVTADEIKSHAGEILDHWLDDRRRDLVRQAVNQAASNGRGVTGLRRVLRSLELGEVQTLLLGENLQAHAVECTACGHIDAHLVSFCPVCGRATQEIVDVSEAVLPWVIRRDIETFFVKGDPHFDKVGNVAALLRFRSEKVQPISTPVTDELERTGTESSSRRRFVRGRSRRA